MANKRFLYGQIYDSIIDDIRNGKIKGKDRLLPEEELAAKYGASIITVKKALSLLKTEKIVSRVPGVGTFVADNVLDLVTKIPSKKHKENDNSKLLGVILEHVASPFGLEMMYSIDSYAEEHGYKTLIRFSYTEQHKESEEIDFLLSMGVCGIILMPSHARHYSTEMLKLVVDSFPVVLVDKKLEGVPFPAVYNDNENSIRMIIQNLYQNGHRDIGLLTTNPFGISSLTQRRDSFYEIIKEYGLKQYDDCVLTASDDIISNSTKLQKDSGNVDVLRGYFADNKDITAVVSLEFSLLACLEQYLTQAGITIPDQMSIITFDEDYDQVSKYFYTHVKQDEQAIARKAVDLMIQYIEGQEKPEIKSYKVVGKFMKGQSVSNIKHKSAKSGYSR